MECLRQASGSPSRPHCSPVVSDEKHHGKWKSHSHKAKIYYFNSFPYTSRCEFHNIVYSYETFFFLSKSQNFEAWTKTEKTTEDELLSGRTGQL